MRIDRQAIAWVVGLALAGVFMAGHTWATGDPRLTAKDGDALILYEYSLLDAERKRSSKITTSTEGDTITYRYDAHALSCRTVMTGAMSKTVVDGRTRYVGAFDVSKNSYGIERLVFDFRQQGNGGRTGTMTVDGKVIDVKLFDRN
jgi:hypothetical protein